MKLRIRIYIIPILLVIFFSFSCSQSPEDKAVNGLIDEASGLVKEAAAIRAETPEKADLLESKAVSLLEEALFQYPSSEIVTKLYNGGILVGPYTIHGLEDRVASRMKIERYKAGGEEEVEPDPLVRAERLSDAPGPPYLKAVLLCQLADRYIEAGDSLKVSGSLAGALAAAEEIDKDYFKSRALAIISEEYNLSGDKDRAEEILDRARKLADEIKYLYFQSLYFLL